MHMWHRSNGSEFLIDCNIETEASHAARKALQRGRFDEVEAFITRCTDVNERCHAIESLADWHGDDDAVEAWMTARPSPVSTLVNGIHKAKWAWEARGGGYAPSVAKSGWSAFAERLPIAKKLLLESMRSDPRDATAVPWLIWISLGMADRGLREQAFAEGVRRQKGLRAMYSALMVSKAARWSGSSEEQLAFAREWAQRTPPTSCVAVLVVRAHDMAFEDGDFGPDPNKYWRQMSVVSDILAANDACAKVPLEGVHGAFVRQYLAYGLWRCGQFALAKPHFQAVGKGFNDSPWYPVRRGFNWLFSPLRKARRESLRA